MIRSLITATASLGWLVILPSLSAQNADDYYRSGYVKAERGDVAGAIADYSTAIALDPRNAGPFHNRGNLRLERGDLDGAMEDFTQAITLNPRQATSYNSRGNTRLRQGDETGALADFNRAIQLDPRSAAPYNGRSLCHLAKRDFDAAIADCTRAIELNPLYAPAFDNRGSARQYKQDFDGAMADFSRAIELNPRFADAYNNRGNVRWHQGDLDGAITDSTKAIGLNPGFANAYRSRALARKAKGDEVGANEDLQKALGLTSAPAGVTLSASETEQLRAAAGRVYEATTSKDADTIIALTHHSIKAEEGGDAAFARQVRAGLKQDVGLKITKVEVGNPTEAHAAGDELVAFVPIRMEAEFKDVQVISRQFLVAVRPVSGSGWTFLDGNRFYLSPGLLRKLFPQLPINLKIPEYTTVPVRRLPMAAREPGK